MNEHDSKEDVHLLHVVPFELGGYILVTSLK